jgi:hypothetical protein
MIARSTMLTPSKLAADEEHFFIQSHHDGLMLFLR